MKISFNWIKELLNQKLTIDQTSDLLTDIGLEVEGIEDYKKGDSYSKIAWKKSIIKNKKYIKKFEEPKKENNLILNFDNYKEIPFEDLLGYVSYIIDYYYKNKIELTIKHRDNTFYLNHTQNSFYQILKYLANVKN